MKKITKIKISIDFDLTISAGEYPECGPPVPHAIEIIKLLMSKEYIDLILFTCRNGLDLECAIDWCKKHGLEFDAYNHQLPGYEIYSNKVVADYYIDDKSIGTPMREWEGKRFVDWIAVEQILKSKSVI